MSTTRDPVTAERRTVDVPDPPRDPAGAVDLDALARLLAPCDLLESAPGVGWSYLVPHAGTAVVTDDGRRTRLRRSDGTVVDLGPDPFAAIDRLCEQHDWTPDATADPGLPPFAGGLVGALAYDLGRRVERLPVVAARDRDHPHLHLRATAVVVAVPPDRSRVLVVGPAAADDGALRPVVDRLRRPAPPAPPLPTASAGEVRSSLSHEAHLAAVAAVLERVAAGDVFQVNLAQRLTARWDADLPALYRALRRESPAPFGAALPGAGVASISPETFLAVDGRAVTTRPIKGTRPRATDPSLDAALADDLATAVKDRAENVMVVDLERNDLGRVCEPGTVHVPELAIVERHPTVWHLVSTVTGQLRGDVGYGGLLRATFPCGSITGAPKIAAMRLIEQLEPVRRGWYCGAVGFLAAGAARLSVAIRTATLSADGTVDYGAGGGIVADSDPTEERAESLDKAVAFLRAVGATGVAGDDRRAPSLDPAGGRR